jgi:hypothetical protein
MKTNDKDKDAQAQFDAMLADPEMEGRLIAAGRDWLRKGGVTLSDEEVAAYMEAHIPIWERLGLARSGPATLALVLAYQRAGQRVLTDKVILAVVRRADAAEQLLPGGKWPKRRRRT